LDLGLDLLKQLPVPDWDGRLRGRAATHLAILPDDRTVDLTTADDANDDV
jgi:hypothetical protein